MTALSADVRDEESMALLFAQVESDFGEIEVCVHNGGANNVLRGCTALLVGFVGHKRNKIPFAF